MPLRHHMLRSDPATTSIIHAPPGQVSNFENPESRARLQVSFTSTLLGIALLFYFNRIYVKLCLLKRVTWDDATLLVALIIGITFYACSTWGIEKGHTSRHLWDLNQYQGSNPAFLVPLYIEFVLPPIALVCLKATFFIFYLYLFGTLIWARIICGIMLGAIATAHTVIAIYSFAVASPYRSDWWAKAEKVMLPVSVISLMVDVVILAIPILAISKLNLTTRKKIGAGAVFLTGVLACGSAAFSIWARFEMKHRTDKTWSNSLVTIGTQTEFFIGTICACAPSFANAFKHSNSVYRRVYQTLSSHSSSRSTGRSTITYNVDQASPPMSDMLKSTDRKYRNYFELNGSLMASSVGGRLDRQSFVSVTVGPGKAA